MCFKCLQIMQQFEPNTCPPGGVMSCQITSVKSQLYPGVNHLQSVKYIFKLFCRSGYTYHVILLFYLAVFYYFMVTKMIISRHFLNGLAIIFSDRCLIDENFPEDMQYVRCLQPASFNLIYHTGFIKLEHTHYTTTQFLYLFDQNAFC